MSYPYFDLVQRAFDDLKREGLIGPRPGNPDQIEQDKGLITRRAAWYVNQQRDATIGLLEKTTGNNSLGYSVDWHVRSIDGEGWDVATDNGVEALPSNGGPYGANPDNIPRWRPPTAELAQMPDDGGGTQPEPTPPPTTDRTDEVLQAIADSEARINAHTTDEADRVIARLNELRQEVIDFADVAGKVLVAIWAKRQQEP